LRYLESQAKLVFGNTYPDKRRLKNPCTHAPFLVEALLLLLVAASLFGKGLLPGHRSWAPQILVERITKPQQKMEKQQQTTTPPLPFHHTFIQNMFVLYTWQDLVI